MVTPVKVWRRYKVVSLGGTQGTFFQRLLVFTTARQKAPAGILDSALRRHHVNLRALMKRDERLPLPGIRRGSAAKLGGLSSAAELGD